MHSNKKNSFDYIIVGAGSAGCVVANRLSENPNIRVLLIEAGGSDNNILIKMPGACPIAARDKRFDWGYVGEAEPHCNNRRILEHRGKVLGGSSSINGMVANRGSKLDYDGWAKNEGLHGWSFEECLPYFKKMESSDKTESEWRGKSGPQIIETCLATHPLHQAFIKSGIQAGYEYTDDQNGAQHEGFHIAQKFTHKGKRHSTSDAYLKPARHRKNLYVSTHTYVHRILFDGRRSVGVIAKVKGNLVTFESEREVILSCGAINSPQLLMVSGIGAPDHLAEHNISLVADVPAVGRNLENHQIVPITFGTPKGLSLSHKLSGLGKYKIGLEWLLFKSGIGASTMCETGCFFKSSDDAEYADLQHEFYPITAEMGEPESNFDDGFMFSMGLMRPESRGSVTLKSANPEEHPKLVYNFFASHNDRRVMINGLKRTREMASQQAFDLLRNEELSPGSDIVSDKDILAWLKATASSEYHPSSTCRMGLGDDSVTDPAGKVHNTEGLRIIDASIMPHNVTANLNAPVIMMAEKLSDEIKKEHEKIQSH